MGKVFKKRRLCSIVNIALVTVFLILCQACVLLAATGEEDKAKIATYKALASGIEADDLIKLKKTLLEAGSKKDERFSGAGEDELKQIGAESGFLDEMMAGADFEQKLIMLILMEKDERDKEALKSKLKELIGLRKELEEEKAMQDQELRQKVIEQREKGRADKNGRKKYLQ